MDIIWAIRELCRGENGFIGMFDKEKSGGKLARLTGGGRETALFEALIYGRAREALVELINDAYNYKEHAAKVRRLLMSDGLSTADADKALDIFFEAFGFPGYRHIDNARVDTVINDNGNYRTEYRGEAKDGKEHGVGSRNCYYEGELCSYDEAVWINGVMNGYFSAKDIEFGMFEVKRTGFLVDDHEVGRTRCVSGEDEYYDDGRKISVD